MPDERYHPLEQPVSDERDLEYAFSEAISLFRTLRELTALNPSDKAVLLDLGLIVQNVLHRNVAQTRNISGSESLDSHNRELRASAAKSLGIPIQFSGHEPDSV